MTALFLLCGEANSTLKLSDLSDIAQVIIALTNLLLAGYIFFYQIKKDKKTDYNTSLIHEQNIKLQWFKELIIQPNMFIINTFYTNLQSIKDKINSNDLTIEEKEDINNFIKCELSTLRIELVDALLLIDKNLADKIMTNLDTLIDGITETIFNEELKLKVPAVYEKNIGSKISYSKNNLLALLYNYKGISP